MAEDQFLKAFPEAWAKVQPFTMTSEERGRALWNAVRNVTDNQIQGCFVECGVWRGGSVALMALALLELGRTDQTIYLFDTFDGMTAAGKNDVDLHGTHADALIAGAEGERVAELVKAHGPIDVVKELLKSTGYPFENFRFIQGDVRELAAKTQTLWISLLRLDTDFEDSTRVTLEELYPRVTQNGIVIIDDYGHWQGAKLAVDTYFEDRRKRSGVSPFLWEIDYTGRGFVKTEPRDEAEIARYDRVPPGFDDPGLLALFEHAEAYNPWLVTWPFLRMSVPHIFRVDPRDPAQWISGFASYEEAVSLYNLAKQFKGKRGLEIGSHFGWTGAHLLRAGLNTDFIDPAFADKTRFEIVSAVFEQVIAGQDNRYKLWPLFSPEAVDQVFSDGNEKFSFVFIDGNHDDDAPRLDAEAVTQYCADDCIVVFHDLMSPFVTEGWRHFQLEGWNCEIFNTMQIIGVASRGNVKIPKFVPDPNVFDAIPVHLKQYLD